MSSGNQWDSPSLYFARDVKYVLGAYPASRVNRRARTRVRSNRPDVPTRGTIISTKSGLVTPRGFHARFPLLRRACACHAGILFTLASVWYYIRAGVGKKEREKGTHSLSFSFVRWEICPRHRGCGFLSHILFVDTGVPIAITRVVTGAVCSPRFIHQTNDR